MLLSKLGEICMKKEIKNIYLWTDTTCDYKYYQKNKFKLVSEFETLVNDKQIKTLIYYADNVLTDEDDNPITSLEMEEMIGIDALDHFGEYEDDSVYVRDENNEIDYEILRSEKMFSEIPKIGCAN